jgi:hypothetical protein
MSRDLPRLLEAKRLPSQPAIGDLGAHRQDREDGWWFASAENWQVFAFIRIAYHKAIKWIYEPFQISIMSMSVTKLAAVVLIGICLNIPAARAGESDFVLCGAACGDAKFYIGYNRTNLSQLDRDIASLPIQKDRIYPQRKSQVSVKPIENKDRRNRLFRSLPISAIRLNLNPHLSSRMVYWLVRHLRPSMVQTRLNTL